MFYLFFATILSAAIAIIFKYAERYNTNLYFVTSTNYLTASIISLVMIINNNLLVGLEKDQSFFSEWKFLLSQEQYILSPYNSLVWGVLNYQNDEWLAYVRQAIFMRLFYVSSEYG